MSDARQGLVRAIHQFVPSLAARDAIGSHTLAVQTLLREMGFESEIFADEIKLELDGRAQPYARYRRQAYRADTWLLYQSSIGSPIAGFLAERREPKILNYHNITPAHLLEGWDPYVGEAVTNGRRQLELLAPGVSAAIAVSSFNRMELVLAGYRSVAVAPPLIDLQAFDQPADAATLRRLEDAKVGGGRSLLFVGRISPNKAQHDLVKMLFAYRRVYDPLAQLHLVGASFSDSYREALLSFAHSLGLEGAVHLAGSVTPGQLAAYYQAADAFVCCSDHEGFCIPLLEAMYHRLPIVAYGAAAVPETVGGGGLVIETKEPARMAAAVHRVLSDPGLRQALIVTGQAHLSDFRLERTKAQFAAAVTTAISRPAGQPPVGQSPVGQPRLGHRVVRHTSGRV
ncbi:MAG: hypothetical protein DLM54_07455 [Acidimicrobiales bacterium]|nr:MAG: hypothetical protein DLM54_07455 [Acidimicrobiales bacterium]